jgi:YidC/Oxa1 family membrane protein insertase
MMNETNNKNFILAIVLSTLIIFGWQYFYAWPLADKAKHEAEIAQTAAPAAAPGQAAPGQAAAPAGAVPSAAAPAALTRDQALAGGQRLHIETPDLVGSINLTGAQFDDLQLTHYRETIDPQSPAITLLTPSGAPDAFFAEQGFVGTAGSTVKLPDSKTVWTAPAGAVLSTGKPVTLTWDNGAGLTFSREISVDDQYVFTVKQNVTNNSGAAVSLLPYARIQRQDTPKIAGYWVFYEGMLGWLDDKLQEVKYAAAKTDKEPTTVDSVGGWIGFTDKYWAATAIPGQSTAITSKFTHTNVANRDIYQTDYVGRDPIVVQSGASAAYQDQLFAGAKVVNLIQSVGDKYQIKGFDLMIDWGWFRMITKPMFYLLEYIKNIVGNFGIAILITTVLIKLAVFPLANRSYASMSKMKKLQPEIQKLKELYPDDKMKQQQGMMELYKREKVSPVSGCLPVVVQIPVFFSLYKVILTSIELRHAPFYGWVHDLSAPDPSNIFTLFGLINWMPPSALHLGIWPILMGITMWVQMRLNPTPPDPVQASLFNWMPIMFTFMLGSFPVGLVIYWAWSNLLSVIQQSVIMKRNGTEIDLFGNIRESIPFLKKKPAAQ